MQGQIFGMYYDFTTTQIVIAAIVLVLVVGIAVAAYMNHRRRRTVALKSRFGPEYDRAVRTHGSLSEAEAKLADRQDRVKTFEIRELGDAERDRFVAEWQTVQSRFVDHPKAAVIEADDLINGLLETRGYPRAQFEQRAADVSVSYPRVMEGYRQAHAVAVRVGGNEATTEELRNAMIQYRAMFDELVQIGKPANQMSAA